MKITDIDKNFLQSKADENGVVFFDVRTPPLEIDGFSYFEKNNRQFFRMDLETNHKQNVWVQQLAWHTAGGCIRFKTDSKVLAIKVVLQHFFPMAHMPFTGMAGVDIYLGSGKNKVFYTTIFPPLDKLDYEGSVALDGKMNEITINLPLYSGIADMKIGVTENFVIDSPSEYTYKKPVLFYGSSITQGGCASRPGNAYTSILCRRLDVKQINLGFSGSAHGEIAMADYICDEDISVFVMDYDHNSINADTLKATHYPFYEYIRNKKPELPIIMISKPDIDRDNVLNSIRREVIKDSYKKALANKDSNIYFIDGEMLFMDKDRDCCTVDSTHPNDLGFYRMAETIYPMFKKALESTLDRL